MVEGVVDESDAMNVSDWVDMFAFRQSSGSDGCGVAWEFIGISD